MPGVLHIVPIFRPARAAFWKFHLGPGPFLCACRAVKSSKHTCARTLTPRLARICYCYLESKAQARFGTTSARMHMVNQLLCARASTQPHAVTASRQGAVAAPSLVRQLNSQTRLSIQRRGRYVQLVRFHITIPTLIILQVQRYFSNKIIETIV